MMAASDLISSVIVWNAMYSVRSESLELVAAAAGVAHCPAMLFDQRQRITVATPYWAAAAMEYSTEWPPHSDLFALNPENSKYSLTEIK